MHNVVAVLMSALLGVATTSTAHAQNSRDEAVRWCQGEDEASPDRRIGACTFLIQSGSERSEDLSHWFQERSRARLASGNNVGALIDAQEAIRLRRSWDTLATFAEAKMATGDLLGALEDAGASVEAARGTDSVISLGLALSLRARVRQATGELHLALDDLNAAVVVSPHPISQWALLQRSRLKRRMGDHVGADRDNEAASRTR